MLENKSFGFKLTFSYIFFLVFIGVVSAVGIFAIMESVSGFSNYRQMAKDTILASNLRSEMLTSRMKVKNYLIYGRESDKSAFLKEYKKFQTTLSAAQSEIINSERASKVDLIETQAKKYKETFERVSLLKEKQKKIHRDQLDVIGPKVITQMRSLFDRAYNQKSINITAKSAASIEFFLGARLNVIKYVQAQNETFKKSALSFFDKFNESLKILESKVKSPEGVALLGAARKSYESYQASFLAYVGISNEVNSLVVDTLDVFGPRIVETAKAVELSVGEEEQRFGPELSSFLIGAKNSITIVGGISMLIALIGGFLFKRSVQRVLVSMASEVKNSFSLVKGVSENILVASRSLEQKTSEQSTAITQTSSSAYEISEIVNRNAESAKSSLSITTKTADFIREGNRYLSETKASIAMIKEKSDFLKESVEGNNQELEGIVKLFSQIDEKTKVINDIVFQTKILSFNASVEAARAGESGKGFAVVAEEIGTLAEVSGKSSEEITQLLQASSQQVKEIVKSSQSEMNEATKATDVTVNEGLQKINECEQVFMSLSEGIAKVKDSVESVSHSSTEQSAGVKEINGALSLLSDTVSQSFQMAGSTRQSSDDLQGAADKLEDTVVRLESFVTGRKSA